jgi:F0F1-type ATP synthase assembly protein I
MKSPGESRITAKGDSEEFLKADISHKRRSTVALLALGLDVFIAAIGVWFTWTLANIALTKHWMVMQLAAIGFGLGAVLLVCEAIDVLLKSRTGPMPIAMSSKRPLGWAAIVAVAIGMLLGVFALTRASITGRLAPP